MSEPGFPALQQIVLDSTDARRLAEFYGALLGYRYRSGDEPPPSGVDDPSGRDWLVLVHPSGAARLAFQQVAELAPSTWPEAGTPQQLHLDLIVPDGHPSVSSSTTTEPGWGGTREPIKGRWEFCTHL